MMNRTHLDALVATTEQSLRKHLLETFRDSERDPNSTSADSATRLKNVMEEAIQEEPVDAASDPHHS
jgi:hypothetical protein